LTLDNFRTIELIWDKVNKSIIETIKTASSDETGRYFSVKVLDEGQEVDLTGAKLQLYWEHPNFNTTGTDDFTTIDAKGLFKLTFSDEMLTNVGELNAHLILTLSDGKITSDGFPIEVIKGADDGVVVPTNGSGLVKQIDGKIDKGNVTLNDLTQEVKLAMTGGSVAVVGVDAVGTENIKDGAVNTPKIADGTITPEKTSFAKKIGLNIFDSSKVQVNKLWQVDATTELGYKLVDLENYSASGVMQVLGGQRYWFDYVHSFNGVFWLDASGKLISTANGSGLAGYLNAPTNASGAVMNINRITNLENFFVGLGSSRPAIYNNANDFEIDNLLVDTSQLKGKIPLSQLNDLEYENAIDPNKITPNKWIDGNGETTDVTTVSLTDYIKVTPGERWSYTEKVSQSGGYFNYDLKYVGKPAPIGTSTDNNQIFEIPDGVSYMRLNIMNTRVTQASLKRGDTAPTPGTPYGFKFSGLINQDETGALRGVKVDFIGDSITWLDGNSTAYTNGNAIGYQEQARLTGATVMSYGVSGATYRQYDSTISNQFHYSLYDDIVLNNLHDFSNSEIAALFGGHNDIGRNLNLGTLQPKGGTFDPKTTLGAIQAIIEYIYDNKNDVKLILATPIVGQSYSDEDMSALNQALKAVADLYSIRFVNLNKTSGINDLTHNLYQYDGLHPNNLGMVNIGKQFVSEIKYLTGR